MLPSVSPRSTTDAPVTVTGASVVAAALVRRPSGRVREVPLPFPASMGALFGPARQGGRDPGLVVDGAVAWWATRTPDGPGTARYVARPRLGTVVVQAWGPGAAWLVEYAPHRLGVHDSLDGFDPSLHPVVARCAHRLPHVRFTATRRVFEMTVPSICGQKVAITDAHRSYAGIVRRWGQPAPGPAGQMPALLVPPSAATLAGVPGWALHPLGLERKRADTITRAARVAARLEEATVLPGREARTRLACVPGLGIWTSAEVAALALGDADAVSVGDYHLKHLVVHALAGRPRGTDAEMLELLAPFAGHRGRVARLLAWGVGHAPRYGPRLAPQPWVG